VVYTELYRKSLGRSVRISIAFKIFIIVLVLL